MDLEYYNDLKNENDVLVLNEIFETIEKVPNISPGIVEGALKNELTDDDYKIESVKKFIELIYTQNLQLIFTTK